MARAKSKKRDPNTPPAKNYLVEVTQPIPIGEKCEHTSAGFWLVAWGSKLYTFDPPTQLQKDIWLGDSKRIVGEETAIAALRWCCRQCCTVQVP